MDVKLALATAVDTLVRVVDVANRSEGGPLPQVRVKELGLSELTEYTFLTDSVIFRLEGSDRVLFEVGEDVLEHGANRIVATWNAVSTVGVGERRHVAIVLGHEFDFGAKVFVEQLLRHLVQWLCSRVFGSGVNEDGLVFQV